MVGKIMKRVAVGLLKKLRLRTSPRIRFSTFGLFAMANASDPVPEATRTLVANSNKMPA